MFILELNSTGCPRLPRTPDNMERETHAEEVLLANRLLICNSRGDTNIDFQPNCNAILSTVFEQYCELFNLQSSVMEQRQGQ